MGRNELIARITESGCVAVVRAPSSEQLVDVSRALAAGGIIAVEITMTTPNALEVIKAVSTELSDEVIVGVGSVLDSETARAAILAGAEYVVSPVLDIGTIQMAHRYDKAVVPGAYTPTEILAAWTAGADVVKVFPASVGGPSYFKAVKGPLPQVKLTPTGGVNLNTASDFIRAGAEFLGVGSNLVSKDALARGDMDWIRDEAAKYVEVVKTARAGMKK
ncbi:MAG: bifunctional 4-hydroxy-2-oxoglutarate aldolase/2-dehydro-3-deoxy-phosphogluconate aldolase [Planctomycetes bacterium]|nr:bifunctional 4-hydroxy-2-oxoglutarate aldolase/2-dehydro-3-deoxy-phosphogluconate aldolase [Planctomycetota bacterium]